MKFTFAVKQADIDHAYNDQIKQKAKNVTIKGFRKGQAPPELVAKKLGESKLQQLAIEQVIPQAYRQAIAAKKLAPISFPKIEFKTKTKTGDWQFQAHIAQAPKITLGDYKKALKGKLGAKIWTPQQNKQSNQNPNTNSQEENLDIILKALIDTASLTVPKLLIEQETNRMLSRLVDQIEKLNLKMDDYLKSIGKSSQQLKDEYSKSAENTLRAEFILEEITKDLKVTVPPGQIDDFIANISDPKTKQALSSPEQKHRIHHSLLRTNTIKELEKLAS